MKYKLHLDLSSNRLASSTPKEVELKPEQILCNDVHLPDDSFNPHNVRLWVIGNEYGPMGAVWASNEGDAIDELIDQGLADGILIDEKDADDETPRGGNAGEPYNQDYLWMGEVDWDIQRDYLILFKLAEAKGGCLDHLGKL